MEGFKASAGYQFHLILIYMKKGEKKKLNICYILNILSYWNFYLKHN